MIDERTERLINRRLDGELSDAESLELNKRLIRSPEARELLETCERHDRLASETLRAWRHATRLPGSATPIPPAALRRRFRRYVAPGLGIAAAAMLAISLVSRHIGWEAPASPQPHLTPRTTLTATTAVTPDVLFPPVEDPLIQGPREETHQLYRNVLGIYDEETQSLYVLELDQHARKVVPVAMNF